MAKTTAELLKEAEQKLAEHELKVARLRERHTKEQTRKARLLSSVVEKMMEKDPQFARVIEENLRENLAEKDLGVFGLELKPEVKSPFDISAVKSKFAPPEH